MYFCTIQILAQGLDFPVREYDPGLTNPKMKKHVLLTAVALVCVLALSAQVPVKGLVAFYPFNGNTKDSSGHELHAVNLNAILRADRFGNTNAAYGFDGNCGIDRMITARIGIHTTLTFSAWFKCESLNTKYPFILNYGTSNSLNVELFGDTQSNRDNGTLGLLFAGSVNKGKWASYAYDVNDLADHRWHHLVATFATGDSMYIYIDGTRRGQAPFLQGNSSDDVLQVGGVPDTGPEPHQSHFNGSIDDIRIYDRKLTDIEIRSLYYESGWPETAENLTNSRKNSE